MPNPKSDESKSDFMSRCVPYVKNENEKLSNDAAVAKCNGIWEQHKGGASVPRVQTGNQNLAVFSEPFKIIEDSHCCLKVSAVIAKEGVYDFPAGPNGENVKCLWSRMELLKEAKAAKRGGGVPIIILDHPPEKVITSQEEIYGAAEDIYFDRDRIRSNLNFSKDVCDPDFLDGIRRAAAQNGPPKDVSKGFYYYEDWTPGVWHGQRYDMVMRNMKLDHVAAGVWKGRCSFPNCGIGVSSKAMAAFLNSRVSNNKGGKKQVSEENPENDEPNFDEHGCKVGLEEWDGEKCVAIEKKASDGDSEGDVATGSEGESPTAGAPANPPSENRGDVDEHGCYSDETWSEERGLCVPNRDETEETVGEDKAGEEGESTQPETAAVLIARADKLLKLKSDRDIERVRAERRHPA